MEKCESIEDEELTYEILEEEFRIQDKLIAEGKMNRSGPIYGFTPEGRRAFDLGITAESVFKELEEKYGLKL